MGRGMYIYACCEGWSEQSEIPGISTDMFIKGGAVTIPIAVLESMTENVTVSQKMVREVLLKLGKRICFCISFNIWEGAQI